MPRSVHQRCIPQLFTESKSLQLICIPEVNTRNQKLASKVYLKPLHQNTRSVPHVTGGHIVRCSLYNVTSGLCCSPVSQNLQSCLVSPCDTQVHISTLHYCKHHFGRFIAADYIAAHYITAHYITTHYIAAHYISTHFITAYYTNRYTKLENLAWSQTVFLQFTFCRKCRFMKPLLLSSIANFIHNTGCLFLTDMMQ